MQKPIAKQNLQDTLNYAFSDLETVDYKNDKTLDDLEIIDYNNYTSITNRFSTHRKNLKQLMKKMMKKMAYSL